MTMTIQRKLRFAATVACLTQLATPAAFANGAVIEFGGFDTLFVSHSAQNEIRAYKLPELPNSAGSLDSAAYNLLDFGTKVSELLGTPLTKITFEDLAVHPTTKMAYVSVTVATDLGPVSKIITVNQLGEYADLDLSALENTSTEIENTATDDVTFWDDIPASTLSVTDMDFVDGTLYVSGLSTGEFASTLRQFSYPFGETQTSSIEVYHAAHNQNETRAPIRAMTVLDVDGSPTVVAAYTCTPLVTMPVSDLVDGEHVIGKTIAELGYGNLPVEVLSFKAMGLDGQSANYVLVINAQYDADLISMPDLQSAVSAPGLKDPIPYLGATSGVATTPLPLSGVMQADDQDAQFLLMLRRELATGEMELVSFRKGAYFRLSDFISEYNFADYQYGDSEADNGTRMFQNLLKSDEGFESRLR
ncbi:MAG: hypothetical protein AAGA63_00440 [Pseudomonadota bacterium]